ncbi:hypothetical protein HDU81_001756 [Chytriomyces hyalinus]|nr:hypothetical protein HDU81_001756 [Chytriomyces hyalinus]
MTDFVTVSQTPDGLVTATLWLDSLYLLRFPSRATNVQASFSTDTGLAPICTATGQIGPANKNCPDGMGLIPLKCYSIACTGPLNGADAAAGGAASFETMVTAAYSICPPTQPNCGTSSALSDLVRLRSPAITSGPARTSSSVRTSASQPSSSSTAQTTTSKPTTTARNTADQSMTTTTMTNTPSNTQSDGNSGSAGGSSVGMGVGIAAGVVVLGAILFGVFRHRSRTERRKQRLARLSTISHSYPVAFTSAPRPPKKDAPSSAWNNAQPVGLTALEREAAETLARDGNAADPALHQEQSVVMSQVYAAGHPQQQHQQLQQQLPQLPQQQQQQVYAPQYVVPQQMQPQQLPQQAYVYPPGANTAQYPGYYDANGQYHFFNNQGPAPSHT